MFDRRTILNGFVTLGFAGSAGNSRAQAAATSMPGREQVAQAMRRATAFMTDKVAVNGGYVWSYLSDFSRRWGEMEAYPSMIWTQAPGTPEVGQIFLDAFRATGDEAYYRAAVTTAGALIAGQHESGGWNYVIDFEGESSLRRWYETIGRNGWRLEEFQHYYGNATFDDHATVECGRFLLRLYLIRRDETLKPALDKAIRFVLDSQYPQGGWPQRWPRMGEFSKQGRADYTGYITLNDEVADENIDFLLLVLQQLGNEGVREPIMRAMTCYRDLQHVQPTPGWALQYTLDMKPAGARSYEPRAIVPHATAPAIDRMIMFYQLTGDRSFLARVPEALDWLESIELPPERWNGERNFLRHYEPETNRPLGGVRVGSNAQNGQYVTRYDAGEGRGQKHIDVAALRARYLRVAAMDPQEATRQSALLGRGPSLLPDYVVTRAVGGSDLNVTAGPALGERVADILAALDDQGRWLQEIRTTSHLYIGDGPAEPPPGFVDTDQVGDAWDTSPYTAPSGPMGISTGLYINNMSRLIAYLRTLS